MDAAERREKVERRVYYVLQDRGLVESREDSRATVDSLGAIELMMDIENEFGMVEQIPNEDVEKMIPSEGRMTNSYSFSIGQVVDYITGRDDVDV